MNLDTVRVLLIDDDEDDFVNLRGIFTEIQKSKFQITWKSSYAEGIEALSQSSFDACLLDYHLGEHTGLDLLQKAKEAGISTPVIFLTGHGDFDLDVKAMQSGAADYLIKGQITAPLLERSVRYAMKHALDMRELSEQKENFMVLFNSTFEGIVVHRNGEIVDANAAIGQILGVSSQDLLGTSLINYFRHDFRDLLKQSFSSPQELRLELIGLKPNGGEIFLELSSRNIILKGESIALLGIRDLSQRKHMEAQILQQDRLASLGLLASSLAHEIGTPLGIIRGRAEIIGKSGDAKVKNAMELITGQIDRISKLVSSLLQLARGKQSDFVTNVNLAQITADISNLMSHELSRKNIELKVTIADDLMVRAEPGPLGQVVLNLMVNAVHAIEDSQRDDNGRQHAIDLRAVRMADEVLLEIIDTGCGISESNLPQLFKPFFTTKDIGMGTGLGLATSYKLIQSWGGTIDVESRVHHGTTFRIRLHAGKT